ncbi:MAG: hypothetical protein ACHQVS_02820 [Candidatus Babeliales bacterium]
MHIRSLILLLALTGAGATVYSNDDSTLAPEYMGPAEWIGKGVGRIVDATAYQTWSWVTDPRYDGLTKLRRFGALGCLICATGCFASAAWGLWRNRVRKDKALWKGAGFATLGFLLTLRPEPVYVPCG